MARDAQLAVVVAVPRMRQRVVLEGVLSPALPAALLAAPSPRVVLDEPQVLGLLTGRVALPLRRGGTGRPWWLLRALLGAQPAAGERRADLRSRLGRRDVALAVIRSTAQAALIFARVSGVTTCPGFAPIRVSRTCAAGVQGERARRAHLRRAALPPPRRLPRALRRTPRARLRPAVATHPRRLPPSASALRALPRAGRARPPPRRARRSTDSATLSRTSRRSVPAAMRQTRRRTRRAVFGTRVGGNPLAAS